MAIVKIHTDDLKHAVSSLHAYDKVLLTGTIYTARDAAHKLLVSQLAKKEELPFSLNGAAIYYAGPTKAPDHLPIGSCGPTTSSRMDVFTPTLLDEGLSMVIGKGERNQDVIDSLVKNKAVYLCAIGGAGALACKCIKSCEVIAYEFLGCESVKKLYVEDFPLIVAIDSEGNNIFAAEEK
ncbi:FumA C-terminus/TtdB family hydratase beta subunit [Paludicola sp. MB14-C6]|nr:FumA C-terminus/TtdB family hydratase beta subunit [Paludicola sp. MB14-C6]WMJ24434.1 FumA C-terminus/TtdB family hydratase beta subunit [Paludicola sp. MB14-C6]